MLVTTIEIRLPTFESLRGMVGVIQTAPLDEEETAKLMTAVSRLSNAIEAISAYGESISVLIDLYVKYRNTETTRKEVFP